MNNNISAEISTSPKDLTPPIISSAKHTHEELRKRAVQWLTNTQHCGVVLSELRAFTPGNEIPDAIGWQSHKSIVVECKTSRADFLANKHKPCSRSNLLMGSYRYFFCPAHLLTAEESNA